eukprot:2693631-Karenia_brevis.AAC.1
MVAILQVVDTLLALVLSPLISSVINQHPSCFVGGRPGTQPLDIAFSLQLVVEKALDQQSEGALLQCDVE